MHGKCTLAQLDSNHRTGYTQGRMRFSQLLLVSVVSCQDTLFAALKSAEPGVRYRVVATDDGVTLLELEEDDTGVEEIDRREAEQGEPNRKLGQWIQKPQDESSRKEPESSWTPARLGLEDDSIRNGK